MFCTKCGLKIPDNIKFCPKCGNRVLGNGMAGENLHNTAKAAGEQRQPVRQELRQRCFLQQRQQQKQLSQRE